MKHPTGEVTVMVRVECGTRVVYTRTASQGSIGNPLFIAKQVEDALAEASEPILANIKSEHGDIRDRQR